MILIDISFSLFFILLGFNFKNFFSCFSKSDKRILNILFALHLLISIVFFFYISSNGGDAQHYWETPKTMTFEEISNLAFKGSPSGTVFLLNYIPSNLLGLSFLTGNLMYAQVGFLGFVLIFRIFKHYFSDFSELKIFKVFNIRLFPLIFFLPNFHFWSSGVGKDTLLFFCISSFIYGLMNVKRRLLWIVLSGIIATAVRPHITLFLLVSFAFGFVFDGSLKGYQKTLALFFLLIVMIPLFTYVLNFIQLDSLETDVIQDYTSTKSSLLNAERSSSGVDISGYPLPLKIFTFLYRPLFFDINNVIALVASFENLILILFSIKIVRSKPLKAFRSGDLILKGSLFFFSLGTLAFSLTLGNLGIMLRQKNMFIPWLIIFGFWVLYNNAYQKNEKFV